jgi:hypothetical protein
VASQVTRHLNAKSLNVNRQIKLIRRVVEEGTITEVVVEVMAKIEINEVAVVEEIINRQTLLRKTQNMMLSSMDVVLASLISLLPQTHQGTIILLHLLYLYGKKGLKSVFFLSLVMIPLRRSILLNLIMSPGVLILQMCLHQKWN